VTPSEQPHRRDGRGSAGAVETSDPPTAEIVETAARAAGRARDHLLDLQSPDGWWKGEFEMNISIDAEDLLFREFLGVRSPEATEQAARWIRSQQRPGGWWANFHDGPPDLSITVEGYLALRLAGDPVDAEHMRRAAGWIRESGGLSRTRMFTRIWLALFGEWPWDELPVIPPEWVLLPAWFPLNMYEFSGLGRMMIVPMTLIFSVRPVHPLGFTLDELRVEAETPPSPALARRSGFRRRAVTPEKRSSLLSWQGVFGRLDATLHGYERLIPRLAPLRALRRFTVRRAIQWIIARQEADGSLGGIHSPSIFALIALRIHGYQLDHPALATGIQGIEQYAVVEKAPGGTVRRIEASQSFVWDTSLATIALMDAGLSGEHPALRRAARFLLGEEIRVTGGWSVRRPKLAPGCWGFGLHNDRTPDLDDTAEVVMALRRLAATGSAGAGWAGRDGGTAALPAGGDGGTAALPAGGDGGAATPAGGDDGDARLWSDLARAIDRGVTWAIGMQCRDGGWGPFEADNTSTLPTKVPFFDFGEVTDPPSADVTGHVVEMLADAGSASEDATRRAVTWLLAHQEADGSWWGRWGINHVYGTGAVVPALVAAGTAPDHPAIRRAVNWLTHHQAADGGWGEDARSYLDPTRVGRGEPTPSQTAWALLALLSVDPDSPAVDRGVEWLIQAQRLDGTWDEPQFTGTALPRDQVMIRYHLYRHVFPLMALGRFVSSRRK
jgi:squalene-hopene/tetraprenyl-beta-curcumene cyclase